jgi:sulfate adenylyltransferase subunit 1 (EFTu-like GTPase family)
VVSLLGINQVVVLINKMDLVDWQEARFAEIKDVLGKFFGQLNIRPLLWIPIAAKLGDNVAKKSANLPWYAGPTLIQALEQLKLVAQAENLPLRLPIQGRYRVVGKDILMGRLATGQVKVGQEIVFVPSGVKTKVASVEMFQARRTSAEAGESIGITLEPGGTGLEPVLPERGEVACSAGAPVATSDRFRASVFWLSATPFALDQPLRLRLATQQVNCRIEKIERLVDSSSLEQIGTDASGMAPTQVGHVIIKTDRPVAVETFDELPELGRFILMRGHDAEAGGIVSGVKV